MKSNITKILLLIFFLFLILNSDSYGVSLSPELVEKLREEGRLEEMVRRANLAREKGVWAPNPNPPLKFDKDGSLLTDTLKPIVICVDFDDNVHSHDTSEFSLLLFSKDTFPTGSMRDFYWENSYQTFEVIGDVYGWYRMPRSYISYTCTLGYCHGTSYDYPWNAQKLTEDAIAAADPYVDFSDYDYDGDLWVDALIIVHAGPGAEETGNCCHIWSHKWVTSDVVWKDGVRLYEYNMDPERQGGGLANMGVFAHEFGHTLGAIDVYDTDYSSEGLGDWSIMAHGSWNNGGATPAHFDAWHKYKILGFSEADQLTTNQINVEILQAETSPVAYRLWTSGGGGSQYFLVENRQKVGFDSYLPGHGLVIYHVDEIRPNNDREWCPGDPATYHYKVALEQADGFFELEGCYGSPNRGNSGDPFPGYYDKRAFDDTTTPSGRDYYDDPTQVAVWNISNSGSTMYANMDVTWSRPCLYLDEFTVDDSPPGGDGDGRPEAGETVKLYFTISNIWLPITGTSVIVSADTAGIVFSDDYSYLGDIGTGGSANNNSDPMEFDVDSLFPGRPTIFTLHVEGDTGSGGTYTLDFEVEVWAGNAEILLVDDDSGSAVDYQSYYTDALDSMKSIYDIWDTEGKEDPNFSFNDYRYIIWYTGDHKTDLFTQAQVESLMSFLDSGGGLFMTSQDAVEVLSGSGNPLFQQFLTDYLHVGYDGNTNKLLVMEEPGDEIGDTLWIRPWGIPGADNQTSKDILVPDSGTDTVLVYADPGWVPSDLVAGTKFFNEDFKVVLFGFGFEAISSGSFGGKQLSEQHFVMQRVMDGLQGYTDVFDFEEEHTSIPKSIELFQNYPNPFNPVTSIRYAVNSKQTRSIHTTLKIYNIRGQLVKTLVDEDKSGGDYAVLWDGRDEAGKAVSSGIYFYRLTAGSSSEVKKMVLLK